ncbi:hypothetical protein BDL97_02G066800 [Sphagnum fallax]|nr:hypothetical protein BDL97_02G066800 [Sphagnum fallax]
MKKKETNHQHQASSLWPLLYGTSCCFIEFASLIGSRFDFDRYVLVPRSSPRQVDLIITVGIVTMKMVPSLVRLYEQMPEPKYYVNTDSYNTIRGVDKLIPVDIYLLNCQPKLEAIIDVITKLRKKVAQETYGDKTKFQRGNRKRKGVETLQIRSKDWLFIVVALYVYGFNYLHSQCAYDVTPVGLLASVYHFTKVQNDANQPEEVCIKVFVLKQNPKILSIFWIWKSADFQERESYDMLGIIHESHPCLKRILMPDSWIGWPLRKDYIVPDFYELQDAY